MKRYLIKILCSKSSFSFFYGFRGVTFIAVRKLPVTSLSGPDFCAKVQQRLKKSFYTTDVNFSFVLSVQGVTDFASYAK